MWWQMLVIATQTSLRQAAHELKDILSFIRRGVSKNILDSY